MGIVRSKPRGKRRERESNSILAQWTKGSPLAKLKVLKSLKFQSKQKLERISDPAKKVGLISQSKEK